MNHDPMCPAADTTKQQYACFCSLIARVREDERHWVDKSTRDEAYEKGKRMGRYTALRDAVEVLAGMDSYAGDEGKLFINRGVALAAIEALRGER